MKNLAKLFNLIEIVIHLSFAGRIYFVDQYGTYISIRINRIISIPTGY